MRQDRQGVRTPADLERKYMFGKSFAEVYALAEDAKAAADKASEAVGKLDSSLSHEEIFNRLTNYGAWQGVYRDGENIYMNASFIRSGTLAAERIDADNLKVKAANITGTLTAEQIDATSLKVNAANIIGQLTAGQIDATNLKVSAANVTGQLTASQIDVENLFVKAANITGTLAASQIDADSLKAGVVSIIGDTVTAGFVNALGVSAAVLKGGSIFVQNALGQNTAVMTPGDMTAGGLDISSYGNLHLAANNSFVSLQGGNIVVGGSYMHPTGQATYLGHPSSGMWQALYAYTDTIQTSDRNLKNSIEELPREYVSMFDNLSPVRFKMNNGTSGRYHVGFIAQEVEDAMTAVGIDSMEFAGFVKDVDADGNELYMLRYGEFIGVLAAKIKELDAEVKEMKQNG